MRSGVRGIWRFDRFTLLEGFMQVYKTLTFERYPACGRGAKPFRYATTRSSLFVSVACGSTGGAPSKCSSLGADLERISAFICLPRAIAVGLLGAEVEVFN